MASEPNKNPPSLRDMLSWMSRTQLPMSPDDTFGAPIDEIKTRIANADIVAAIFNNQQHILFAHDGKKTMPFIEAAQAISPGATTKLRIERIKCRSEEDMNILRLVIGEVKAGVKD